MQFERDDPESLFYVPPSFADVIATGLLSEVKAVLAARAGELWALRAGILASVSFTFTEQGLSLYHESRRSPTGLRGVEYQYVISDLRGNSISVHWRQDGYHVEDLTADQDAEAWLEWYRERDDDARVPEQESKAVRGSNDLYLQNKTRIIGEVRASRDRAGSYFGSAVADFLQLSSYLQQRDQFERQRVYETLFDMLQRHLLEGSERIITDLEVSRRKMHAEARARSKLRAAPEV